MSEGRLRQVTSAQIAGVRELVVVALAEEVGVNERKLLRGIDRQLAVMVGQTTLLAQLRKIVEELRNCALPGGPLEEDTKAWLAAPENGGAA
jgi:hypothetical protein